MCIEYTCYLVFSRFELPFLTRHAREISAGHLSYSRASRMGTRLRWRRSIIPPLEANTQRDLEVTNLEMPHIWWGFR